MAIEGTELRLNDHRAYLFAPDSPTRAGILLLPTVGGAEETNRNHSRLLAEAGFTTLLWDPYPNDAPPESNEDRQRLGINLTDQWALEGQRRCIDYMYEDLRLQRTGVLGFCMGGRLGLLLAAADQRVEALVSFYPTIRIPDSPQRNMDPIAACSQIRCPVNLICPGHDHATTQQTYGDLRQTLRVRRAPTTAQMFPEASHGFMQHDGPPADVKVAWGQALAFLSGYLA